MLPDSMKRSIARQAEAERERRARVITADGELQASEKLSQAAEVMAKERPALQLRLLQTVVEVAAEKNSTLILPFPVELLRFLERSTPERDDQEPTRYQRRNARTHRTQGSRRRSRHRARRTVDRTPFRPERLAPANMWGMITSCP